MLEISRYLLTDWSNWRQTEVTFWEWFGRKSQNLKKLQVIQIYRLLLNQIICKVPLLTYQLIRDYILTGRSVITMLRTLFTNLTVKICLFKTNQRNNLSFRIILHLSFSDVLLALVGVPTFIFDSIMNTNSRVLKVASPCITALLARFFMYIIGLLGVDRFVKINYYAKHREIVTLFCVFMAQILI